MKRGEEQFYTAVWSPIGVGIRRSSDGLWEDNGKLLPWFWCRLRPKGSIPGFSMKFGEYMVSIGWLGK